LLVKLDNLILQNMYGISYVSAVIENTFLTFCYKIRWDN